MHWLENGGILSPKGFKASGAACGIKANGKFDLALIVSEVSATAVGVYTQNKIFAACVQVTRQNLSKGNGRAIVINSGNANACTGERGILDAMHMAREVAKLVKSSQDEIGVCSTGRIGVPMPMDKIIPGIGNCFAKLQSTDSHEAELAILTTDQYSKSAAVEIELGGKKVRLGTMAKGAGMIQPHMATMICVIASDVSISHSLAQKALSHATEHSFNRISVDGDMSTNDTVLLFANGMAQNVIIDSLSEDYKKFEKALIEICQLMAKKIVLDGEGASKFVNIRIDGAKDNEQANRMATKVANSMLFKTAMFGEVANWGRAIAAIGALEEELDPNKIVLYMNNRCLYKNGVGLESDVRTDLLGGKEIDVLVNMNMGHGKGWCWTCDLTYSYIDINKV